MEYLSNIAPINHVKTQFLEPLKEEAGIFSDYVTYVIVQARREKFRTILKKRAGGERDREALRKFGRKGKYENVEIS